MPGKPLVSVVLPTYNEAENVAGIIDALERVLTHAGFEYEIVVVDDSSPDLTWVRALEKGSPRVRVLARRVSRDPPLGGGLASAIRVGVLHARGEFVVVMDSDFQHPPEVVPKLVEKALETGADVVIASRYARGGGVEGWSRLRLLMSRAASLLAWVAIPQARATSDPMSGFFLLRRSRVLDTVEAMKPRGFKFLLELLARSPSLRVAEVPYVFRSRAAGRSKLGYRAILDFLVHTALLSPMTRFAVVGLIGTLVNLAVMKAVLGATGLVDAASLAGIEAGLLSNFALNEAWTFREHRRGSLPARLAGYHLASAGGALVTYATMKALHALAGVDPLLGQFTGIIAGFLVNYLASSTAVWRCGVERVEGGGVREAQGRDSLVHQVPPPQDEEEPGARRGPPRR
ncbi:glycosyltransferase [Stetteria hydrogenophila]